jgi:hypothetical protein
MVRHIWECETQLSMNKEQVSNERKWLAERFQCDLGTVAAVTAHLRIRFDNVVPGELTIPNAQFARLWVALAGAVVADRAQYQREIAELLQVPFSTIQMITDGLREDVTEVMESEGEDDADSASVRPAQSTTTLPEHHLHFAKAYIRFATSQNKPLSPVYQELSKQLKIRPGILRALVENETPAQPARTAALPVIVNHAGTTYDRIELLKSGEHVDYDTKSKEAWRQTWKRYLDEHTDRKKRGKMRILCIPGKRCLEIPLYIELGFKPENIVAVEGGDRIARAQFELNVKHNAKKWGGMLDYRLGRLEEMIKDEHEPFDIVGLDFLGQMCPSYLYIASNIPVNERAIFMMTAWTRRWGPQMQRERQESLDRTETRQRENQSLHQEYGGLFHETQSSQPAQPIAIHDVSMGTMNLGADRSEHWQFRQRVRRMAMLSEAKDLATTHEREREEKNISLALEPMMNELLSLLQEHRLFDASSFEEIRSICSLGNLVTSAMFDKPVVEHIERRSYLSTVSTALHEFHTDMSVIQRPRHLYEKWKPIADFFSHCVEHCLEIMRTEGKNEEFPQRMRFEIQRNKDEEALKPGISSVQDDIVCISDERIVGRRCIADLLKAAKEYSAFLASIEHSDPVIQSSVPRKEILY